MLLSVFSTLYQLVIGENSNYPEYEESIFNPVGLYTLVLVIIVCLLFFVVLGRWKPIWHKLVHWVITMAVVALSCFALAFFYAKSTIGSSDGYLVGFAGFNAIMAAVYYVIFSFVLKPLSIFAKKTPF
jgi:drug/metabolite transporter (DMT)-like permease